MCKYLVFLCTILLSFCSTQTISSPESIEVKPSMVSSTSPPTSDPQPDVMVSRAMNDLSSRLTLDVKQIRIISVEPAVWPDTSLGCPHLSEKYVQQTVPGYEIRLEANRQEYEYHTDADRAVILCVEGDLPSFPVTPGEIDDGQPWMPVD